MDLKSMLNDSAAQRHPRLHTPQSSLDARATDHTSLARSESHPSRPSSYPPPLQPVDSRAQSAGGYFGYQSPHPNNPNSASTYASTPNAGSHSAYAPSPGKHTQVYTPRDASGHQQHPYNNASFISPSPSVSVHQPPTPGSAGHYQSHTPVSAQSQPGPPPQFAHSHSQSPRGSVPPNNQINPQSRQISPIAQFQHHQQQQQQPSTPLGPPVAYSKISPSAQRPPSQGLDHYRRGSYGSVGSAQSREYNQGGAMPPELARADSAQRQQSMDRSRDRERSISVSPKTIPQPSPYRQASATSMPGSQRPSVQSPTEAKQVHGPPTTVDVKMEMNHSTPTSKASATPTEVLNVSHSLSSRPSPSPAPVPVPIQQHVGVIMSSPMSASKSSPITAPQTSLKRSASHLSDPQVVMEKSHKRLRRDDVPRFAQSARRKALRLGSDLRSSQPVHSTPTPVSQQQQQQQPPARPAIKQEPVQQKPPLKSSTSANSNGHSATPAMPGPGVDLDGHHWEPTIANESVREDLSLAVANWIFEIIGRAEPPDGNAMFEVEAKIGEIVDVEAGQRLQLPVTTETVFKKDSWRRTKFESSMNMEQHRLLNGYLNELTKAACQEPDRVTVAFEHLREYDDFFELSDEGIKNLNPSIKQWLKPRQAPRVRRTIDQRTRAVKATIIKSRIADLEVFNPGYDFDYRISISIESPWEGNPAWLQPMGPGEGISRSKDRMSYRHLTNQIDLTQVSHDKATKMEHELEVEMSMSQLCRELDKLRNTGSSKFEDLVRSLLDNTRLLCRKGSLRK